MNTPFVRYRSHINIATAGLLAIFILLFGVLANAQIEARNSACHTRPDAESTAQCTWLKQDLQVLTILLPCRCPADQS